jgi:hypothetical protein
VLDSQPPITALFCSPIVILFEFPQTIHTEFHFTSFLVHQPIATFNHPFDLVFSRQTTNQSEILKLSNPLTASS